MNVGVVYGKFFEACTDWSVVFFIVSGFFAVYTYGLLTHAASGGGDKIAAELYRATPEQRDLIASYIA